VSIGAEVGAAASTAPAREPAIPSGRADGVRTGGSRRIRLTSGHEVWVKQVGHGATPVLTLHGGPGATHFYLECFEDFLPRDRVRFWYYDQLGCGFSDQPNDVSLWTIDRFRSEVEEVRVALGLERFVLYGQSWGGLLAIEYALGYPQHVDRVVISSMTASYPSYAKHAAELRVALPADVREAMDRYEAKGAFDAPEYQELLVSQLYSKYLCRLDPWPEPVRRAFQNLSQPVYNTIQGPSEFTITGNAKDWDRWDDLHKIEVPTLLMVGRHDEISVADCRAYGHADSELEGRDLRERITPVHVRRPGCILQSVGAVSGGRLAPKIARSPGGRAPLGSGRRRATRGPARRGGTSRQKRF
jgi:proline iminopeptidase